MGEGGGEGLRQILVLEHFVERHFIDNKIIDRTFQRQDNLFLLSIYYLLSIKCSINGMSLFKTFQNKIWLLVITDLDQ